MPLFSQMKTSGTFQSIAMFIASKNSPSHEAPSPKKQSDDLPGLPELAGQRGAAGHRDVAGDDRVGRDRARRDGSERCIEPPFPLHTPVARPISSAMIATGSTPLISASPCPR